MPEFTLDWTEHATAWPDTLADLRGSGTRALEVGTFEGRSALWLCEWLYGGPLAPGHVVSIDPLTGEGQTDEFYRSVSMEDVGRRLFENTWAVRAAERWTLMVGYSHLVMPLLPAESFHVIYVDGDHTAEAVASDAREAARLCAPGGVVMFDDYGFEEDYPGICREVDRWLDRHDEFVVVHQDYQLHARRRR